MRSQGLAILLVFLVSASPLAASNAPNPSGPGTPTAVVDGGAGATHFERAGDSVFVAQNILEGSLVRGGQVDLTVTNLSLGIGEVLALYTPTGVQGDNSRTTTADQSRVNRTNVTFPALALSASGAWTLRHGNVTLLRIPVAEAPLLVTASPSSAVVGNATLVVTVKDSSTNPIPDATIVVYPRWSIDPNDDLARVNGTGAPGVGAQGQYSVNLTFARSGTYVVDVVRGQGGGRGVAFVTVEDSPHAEFSIFDLRAPSTVAPGENFAAGVSVQNVGTANGSISVDLFENGALAASRILDIPAGATRVAEFNQSYPAAGWLMLEARLTTGQTTSTWIYVQEPGPALKLDAISTHDFDETQQGRAVVGLHNEGNQAGSARLSWLVDGAVTAQFVVTLVPGESMIAALPLALAAGNHAIEARLDNGAPSTYATVHVRTTLRIVATDTQVGFLGGGETRLMVSRAENVSLVDVTLSFDPNVIEIDGIVANGGGSYSMSRGQVTIAASSWHQSGSFELVRVHFVLKDPFAGPTPLRLDVTTIYHNDGTLGAATARDGEATPEFVNTSGLL